MSKLRLALNVLNKALAGINLRLDTITADRLEAERLARIDKRGWFEEPAYPLPASFADSKYQILLDELPKHLARFDTFRGAETNDVGFQFGNGFYESPDVEILYAMVRMQCPRQIVEIGCGHSTKVIQQAIRDGGIECEHVAIDPEPRQDISRLVDLMIEQPVEFARAESYVEKLHCGDILFIDTSHEVKPANDVACIYGKLINRVPIGVIVHIHDIFIPYEYPRTWVREFRRKWGEQYIVQMMLMNFGGWEILWPGYFLQRTLPQFDTHFPHRNGGMAQSLWLQKT
jgi:hypothetical protein